jgi:hypothetical protein
MPAYHIMYTSCTRRVRIATSRHPSRARIATSRHPPPAARENSNFSPAPAARESQLLATRRKRMLRAGRPFAGGGQLLRPGGGLEHGERGAAATRRSRAGSAARFRVCACRTQAVPCASGRPAPRTTAYDLAGATAMRHACALSRVKTQNICPNLLSQIGTHRDTQSALNCRFGRTCDREGQIIRRASRLLLSLTFTSFR